MPTDEAEGAPQFVFGYGSLSGYPDTPPTRAPDPAGYVTDLHGRRRCWGVAMDNCETVPGYKFYLDPDGSRPAVYVAFLDLVVGPGVVNGVCTPVDEATLAELDQRERNYAREDVTAHVAHPLGRVWAYVGSPEGRARLQEGLEGGLAVISREYRDAVVDGFAQLGGEELGRFEASTEATALPIRELQRIDL